MGNEFDDLPPVDVDVPDDPSELERDVQAYRREVRWHRRRERWRWLLSGTQRYGAIVPLVVAIVCVGAMSIALLVMSARPSEEVPPRATLSEPGSAEPGEIGGPLPDVQVTVGDTERQLRALHSPAVFLMAPSHCQCADALHDVVVGARDYGIPVYFVESGQGAPEREGLARQVGGKKHHPKSIEEATGTFARMYGGSGPTAVLVDRHGDVNMVRTNLSGKTDWDEHLAPLRGSWQHTNNG